ncbi:unnamed protein product [Dicrocoelium dendriticum]|nr:unnamed protein product [Dicrocoelium dendriticum]
MFVTIYNDMIQIQQIQVLQPQESCSMVSIIGIITAVYVLREYVFRITMASMWYETSWNSVWDTWWHYKEGVIGGPSHWGHTAYMAYAEDVWPACHRGKLQSPISVSLVNLTYDPTLGFLNIVGKDEQIDLEIINSGQDLRMEISHLSPTVMLTGGPLSYEYKIFGALLKFGAKSERGSDHLIDGVAFPAEFQFYAFNFVLYSNFSSAVSRPHGLAALSVFMQIGENPSEDLSALLTTAEEVQLKGQSRKLSGLVVSALLPSTKQYMTYEGSIPFPACHETVTWIILNQAITVTEEQLKALRELRITSIPESGRMADNFRQPQDLNGRSVRTNIFFAERDKFCSPHPRLSYTVALNQERDQRWRVPDP